MDQSQDANQKEVDYAAYQEGEDRIKNQDYELGDEDNKDYELGDEDYKDNELGDEEGIAGKQEYDKMARLGFVKKVYGILSCQLLLTFSLIFFSFIKSYQKFLISTPGFILWGVSIVVSFVTVIALVCFKSVARRVPLNYILLLIFTICESYMLQIICSAYDLTTVLIAAGLTVGVTIALSVYACTTKTDFTWWGSILFVAVFTIASVGLLWILFRNSAVFYSIPWCFVGICIYSLYLIYDTQLIMGISE